MPGAFNTKKTSPDTMYTVIRGIAKKVFFISLFLYFFVQVMEQFGLTAIRQLFDTTVILGLILAGFIFMITFTQRDPKQPRISRSDWALIGLFGTIALGLNMVLLNNLGIIGHVAAIILFFFAAGLALYVWNGSDESVRFSLFKRDRRYKLTTYIRATTKEWLVASIALLLFLATNYFVSDTATDSPIVTTATPAPTVPPVTQSQEPTPTDTVEPTPLPTAIPEPTATIMPTPVPASSLPNEYKVYVLNGSGVSGVANEIRTLLQTNGVDVHYAGDAGTFDYTETLILFNAGYETLADAIEQVMTGHYQPIQKRPFDQGERYGQYNLVVIHGQ